MKKWMLAILFLSFVLSGFSQVVPAEAQEQLDELGLTEQELAAKLQEKGIDINNIDPSNTAEVEKALEEIMLEMQGEQASSENISSIPTITDAKVDTISPPFALGDTLSSKPSPPNPYLTDTLPKADSLSQLELDSIELADSIVELEIFGHQLFKEQPNNFNLDPVNVKAPDSYLIGAGDEITIAVFGASQANFNFTVANDGYIQPPGIGRIYLKGIALGQAREILRKQFAQRYRFGEGEFAVSITYSRIVKVNIVGEVESPGSYSLPATNTAFNALVAAGGPSEIGSVRKIKLLRNGEPARIFDVYAFLENPSLEQDFFLQDNDYLHVPIFQKLVTIQGAIRRPFKYELIEGENLSDLVELAGGFKENAYQRKIQITRFVNDEKKILDVDYRDLLERQTDFELYNGDDVKVLTVEKPYENFVEVSGPVEFPGEYELSDGMRISDLVRRSRFLRETRRDVAYLFRTREDETVRLIRVDLEAILENEDDPANIELQLKDKLQLFSQVSFADSRVVSSSGGVRTPTEVPFDPEENMRVADLILLSEGLKPNAADFAYIKRRNIANELDIDFVRVNVREALADVASPSNQLLRANDELIVYTNEQFVDSATVEVLGAVRVPDIYPFDEGLRVSDVIYFSDGLKQDATDFAYINRLNLQTQEKEYVRVDLKKALEDPNSEANVGLKPFDVVDVPSKTVYIDETTVSVFGAVRLPGAFKYHESLSLKDVLTLAGGLKFGAAFNRIEVSRVIIQNNQPTQTVVAILAVNKDLEPVDAEGAAFKLKPYDQIYVRNVPEFKLQENITLEGEVKYPGIHPILSDNERLSSVIERAGGLTEEAFAQGATLYREQDEVGYIVMDLEEALKKEKSRFNFIVKPGDLISIPTRKELVTIAGATKAEELYDLEIIKDGKLTVPYHKGKRAKYYVSKYAAGVGKEGKASKIAVVYPTGEVKKTKDLGLFKIYPKVKEGSLITVGKKETKPKDANGEEEKTQVDWGKIVADSIAQATAVLSLVLLIQRVN